MPGFDHVAELPVPLPEFAGEGGVVAPEAIQRRRVAARSALQPPLELLCALGHHLLQVLHALGQCSTLLLRAEDTLAQALEPRSCCRRSLLRLLVAPCQLLPQGLELPCLFVTVAERKRALALRILQVRLQRLYVFLKSFDKPLDVLLARPCLLLEPVGEVPMMLIEHVVEISVPLIDQAAKIAVFLLHVICKRGVVVPHGVQVRSMAVQDAFQLLLQGVRTIRQRPLQVLLGSFGQRTVLGVRGGAALLATEQPLVQLVEPRVARVQGLPDVLGILCRPLVLWGPRLLGLPWETVAQRLRVLALQVLHTHLQDRQLPLKVRGLL
mmetsp:Transcript_100117/g.278956  ORF Transcript_100117/g.278956 Transcript_100117/m.278956 type:complete len:325 (-) Transcript_100117:971-1945(-)